MATNTMLRANPAHSRMTRALRKAITGSQLAAGDRIAGEIALGEQYGISVTSVRKGIEILVDEGLLTRRQGSGTYVTDAHDATATPTPVAVKRDTIAILQHVQTRGYHPYYSELHTGLRSALAQLGWKVWEPAAGTMNGEFGQAPYDWDRGQLWSEVGQRMELAGLVVRPSLLPTQGETMPNCPLVMPDIWADTNYVAYSWEREVEEGMRYLIERGARRIWALGVFPESLFQRALTRAAAAMGQAVPSLYVHHTSDMVRSVSESVHRAYSLAQTDFAAADAPIDGIFVGSDFELQGVLDALAASPLADRTRPCVGLVNKESRISVSRPYARLVLDGHQQGEALASLIHQTITTPTAARRRILLRARFEDYQ